LSTVLKDGSNNPAVSKVSTSPSIEFGKGFDIYLSKFQRWTDAIDPQTAWNSYYAGNGQSGSMSSYGAKLSITNSNILQQELKLF
jgi:hypothetical protein